MIFCLILLLQIFVYIFSIYLCIFMCANIFGAIVLKPRFKIDVVIMIICSTAIIINSVLSLQVSTPSLPHDREPCEIKVVSNHTCSLHTCVCAGSRVFTKETFGISRKSKFYTKMVLFSRNFERFRIFSYYFLYDIFV